MPVSCPRCGGCGYEDCADCKPTMEAKRPGCWRCGGTGRVPCEITPEIDPNDPHPHGVLIPKNGAICDGCDKPTPPGDGGCTDCWTPIPDNLADQKAIFAEMGLSLEKHEGPEAEK